MDARTLAEIQETRRLSAEDHDRPYAALVVAPTFTPSQRDRFRAMWLEAVQRGQAIMVLGPPMRILMPADRNPFPRFRPIRWLP